MNGYEVCFISPCCVYRKWSMLFRYCCVCLLWWDGTTWCLCLRWYTSAEDGLFNLTRFVMCSASACSDVGVFIYILWGSYWPHNSLMFTQTMWNICLQQGVCACVCVCVCTFLCVAFSSRKTAANSCGWRCKGTTVTNTLAHISCTQFCDLFYYSAALPATVHDGYYSSDYCSLSGIP